MRSTRSPKDGVKPMEVDSVGVVVSSQAQPSTEVAVAKVAATSEVARETNEKGAPKAGPTGRKGESEACPVSHESSDAAILAARALSCQPFGAFTFVCRAIRHGEKYAGIPVVVDLEGGGGERGRPSAPPGLDVEDVYSEEGYFPDDLPVEEDEELVPAGVTEELFGGLGDPGVEGEEVVEPWLDGKPLVSHKCRGHWPHYAGCAPCVKARGRTLRNEVEPEGLGADFLFIRGKYWRILVLVMFATGMLGMVVMSGDREKDIRAIVSVMHEIGVGGLNLEIVMNNESSLQSVVQAALLKSNCHIFHPMYGSISRAQAKRLERAVGICKKGIFTNCSHFRTTSKCGWPSKRQCSVIR